MESGLGSARSEEASIPYDFEGGTHLNSSGLGVRRIDDEVTLDRLSRKRRHHQNRRPSRGVPIVAIRPGGGRILQFPTRDLRGFEDLGVEVVGNQQGRSVVSTGERGTAGVHQLF